MIQQNQIHLLWGKQKSSNMTESEETETIRVRADVISQIEERVKYTNFDSTNDYINYVLGEVVHQVESKDVTPNAHDVDEDQVEDRLKSLGYLGE